MPRATWAPCAHLTRHTPAARALHPVRPAIVLEVANPALYNLVAFSIANGYVATPFGAASYGVDVSAPSDPPGIYARCVPSMLTIPFWLSPSPTAYCAAWELLLGLTCDAARERNTGGGRVCGESERS